MCDTGAIFREESSRRLATLSDRVRTAIETVQPYNRPPPELPPLLAILRDFNNVDKHRLLRLVYSAVSLRDIGFCGPSANIGARCQFCPNTGELKDGAEIAAFVFERPTPDMQYDRIIFDVILALWHGKRDPSDSVFHERSDIVSLLQVLTDEVKTVVDIVLKSAAS